MAFEVICNVTVRFLKAMLLFRTIFDSGYTSCFLESSIFSTPFYLIPLEVTPVGFTQMSLISETRVDLCSRVAFFRDDVCPF